MVIDNLHGPIKEAMVLGDCRKFPPLFERAARMQRSLKDGSITFLRNSSNGGEGKPKNTLRTQQPTQEVTISPDQIIAVQAQQNALRQRSTRNRQAIQGGRPPTHFLPNRNRKTQRKLRPDPLITRLRLRPIRILSRKKPSAIHQLPFLFVYFQEVFSFPVHESHAGKTTVRFHLFGGVTAAVSSTLKKGSECIDVEKLEYSQCATSDSFCCRFILSHSQEGSDTDSLIPREIAGAHQACSYLSHMYHLMGLVPECGTKGGSFNLIQEQAREGMVPSAQFFSCLGRESSSLMVFLEEWFPQAVHQSILLQARGWLVGKVSLGRNGPIRITSFESSRCRSESSGINLIYGREDLLKEIIHLTQPRVFRHRPAFRLGRALKKPIFDSACGLSPGFKFEEICQSSFSGSSGNEILCPSQSLKSQACLTAEVGPRTKSSGNQDRASSFAVRTLTSNKERPGGLAPGVPLR
ncbi:hypothetical protein ACFE04_011469 [Oxalis oulophora]